MFFFYSPPCQGGVRGGFQRAEKDPPLSPLAKGGSPKSAPCLPGGYLTDALDDVFSDDPQACQGMRDLLGEITVDELAHIGQRRNFLGARGVTLAPWLVQPVFRGFYKSMSESRYLFDADRMIRDALAFDSNAMAPALLHRSWVPTYCQEEGLRTTDPASA